ERGHQQVAGITAGRGPDLREAQFLPAVRHGRPHRGHERLCREAQGGMEAQVTPMRPFVIDTDTATDDAVALVLALAAKDIQIEAITVVAGNVGLAQTVQNALYTVELCGAAVPVYAGADRPLHTTLIAAENVHGKDGLGDIGLLLSGRVPASGHAADALIAAANKYAG